MTKKRVSQMGKTKENIEEYVVPNVLGILMRWSQIVLVAPVRLRCVDGRWAVRISPGLVIFQRSLVIVTSLAVFFAVFRDMSYRKSNIFSAILLCTKIFLPMVIYSLRVLNSPWKIKRNINLLRQMQKIKSTFKCGTKAVVKSERIQAWLIVAYFAWILIAYIQITVRRFIDSFSNGLSVVAFGIPLIAYQNLVIGIFQLELSLIINELRSTVSMLNDELHSWLETPTVTNIPQIRQNFVLCQNFTNAKIHTAEHFLPKGIKTRNFGPTVHPKASISHLSECYFEICDMVRKINGDNGPFLLAMIAFLFMSFLVISYNLTAVIEHEDTWEITWKFIWCLLNITQLLTLVEPSHRLQEQLKRTRLLVSKLAMESETDRWDLDPAQLEPFLLQMQMKSPALEPMGMCTVGRPLIASIVGAAATSLIMINQFKSVSDHII